MSTYLRECARLWYFGALVRVGFTAEIAAVLARREAVRA